MVTLVVTVGVLMLLSTSCVPERSAPSQREDVTGRDSGDAAAKLGVVIGALDDEKLQSSVGSGRHDGTCPMLVFGHVGDQDKPIPPLVAHVCRSSVSISRRVAQVTGDAYLLPRLAKLHWEELLQLRLATEEWVSFAQVEKPPATIGSVGATGTFDVVMLDGRVTLVGRLSGEHACGFFSEVASWFPRGRLLALARYYRQILACSGAPARAEKGLCCPSPAIPKGTK